MGGLGVGGGGGGWKEACERMGKGGEKWGRGEWGRLLR
jgi:hypothetical protein